MTARQQSLFVLASIFVSLGASYRTTNFFVEAPTSQAAQLVGQWAEYYRKEKAHLWLGHEMPPWSEPCPVRVKLTTGGAGGATSFNFMNGQVWQTMQIEGALDRLLASVLPHEVTHTVFAYYFRCPVPRWADEGGSVLSEDEVERNRHDLLVRQILRAGDAMHLRQLFTLRDYPRDVGTLYAEGYSVSDFLVGISDRPTFLKFVAHGMQYGWDSSAQTYYRYQNVNQLEQAWIDYLRQGRHQPPTILARNTMPAATDSAMRVVVRLTAPPVQPLQDAPAPIFRAQAPDADQVAGWDNAPKRLLPARQGYLPEYAGNPTASPSAPAAPLNALSQDGWQAPGVSLGKPQFEAQPSAPTSQKPGPASPVGYPN